MRLPSKIVIIFALAQVLDAFSPLGVPRTTRPASRLHLVAAPPPPGEDSSNKPPQGRGGMQPEEEFNLEERGATVDWDAEWKKVVKDQQAGKSVERPGEGYYKSEAEIAAIRAANKATEQMGRAASQMPSMPSFDSLKGDWKFWIGIIVIISVGTSLLTASVPVSDSMSSGGSYYI